MAEGAGIVMTLYDRVSPTLKSYAKNQDALVSRSATLKKAMAESSLKVQEAQKS